jgi:hypothetical protein
MAFINDLFDDFTSEGKYNVSTVDVSKWATGTPSTTVYNPSYGVRIQNTLAASDLTSVNQYYVLDRSVMARIDSVPTETGSTATMRVYSPPVSATAGARIQVTNGTTINFGYISSGAAVTTLSTLAYNATSMVYWRIRHSSAPTGGAMVYWETSPDGYFWTTRASVLYSVLAIAGIPFDNNKVQFASTKTTSSGATYLTVRYVNTRSPFYTGKYLLVEDWRSLPTSTTYSTAGSVLGQWALRAGSVSFAGDPAGGGVTNKVLSLGASAKLDNSAVYIEDTDLRAYVYLGAGSIIQLRVRDYGGASTTGYLALRIDHVNQRLQVVQLQSGSTTTLTTFPLTITASTWYKYRMLAVGGTLVVYRDDVELFRTTVSTTIDEGFPTIVAETISGATYVGDVEVRVGVLPSTTTAFTMEQPQLQPPNWVATSTKHQLQYAWLEDDFGNKCNILPSFGAIWLRDVDFGAPAARSVINPRTLSDGSRSYTRYHGEKSVAMSLFVLADSYGSVVNYTDALSSWTVPGRECRLVYKPQNGAERYLNLVGSQFQAPMDTTNRLHTVVTLQWIAPDGGSYSTTESSVLMTSTIANAAGYVLVRNGGSDRTEPTFRVFGNTLSTPYSILNDTYADAHPGESALLTVSSPGPMNTNLDYIELNYKERAVRYLGLGDESANRLPLLTSRGWFPLEPGTSVIRSPAPVSVTGSMYIVWKDKFLL